MSIKPADRIQQVKEYYFSKKLAEVKELIKEGKEIINLGIGNPDIATHPEVLKKLIESSSQEGSNFYQSYRGLPELRLAFSNWYKKTYQVDLNPDHEILPLMGSKEGIMHISMAFANPGDQVLVPNPGYPAYVSVSKLLNLEVQHYNLLEKNDWLPDLSELNEIAKQNCKIMWINYPHMPTGAKANQIDFERILSWTKEKNILLVHDNPYSLILNKNPQSILSFPKDNSNVLELNSLSKSHNMAGWRIGMVAGSEQNINYILRVKSNFDSGMFKPVQEAAIKALQLTDNWYSKLNKIYTERREIVWEILDQLECIYDKNTSGLFVWAKIPAGHKNGVELSDFLLYEKSIFITPGSVFGSNGEKYVRLSLCADIEKLETVLNRVSTIKKVRH